MTGVKRVTGKRGGPRQQAIAARRNVSVWAIAIVCVLAGAIRIAAARGELWLDEVWTLRLLQDNAHSPADILFRIAHDNNHVLNSLLMYWAGPNGSAWVYRWPAVLAGALTVVLAGWTQRRRGTATALASVVLIGASYLLVQYSSEARGYAYEVLFSMLAFAILCAADESPSLWWDFGFAATCIVGFLTHPLFVIVFLAAQVWTWFPGGPRSIGRLVQTALFRTALPGLFFAWLYVAVLRHMTIGGGDVQRFADVILQTLSLSVGGPFGQIGEYAAAAIAVALTLAAFWRVFRQSPKRGTFYLSAIIVLPALVLLIGPRQDIYPRYFLGSVFFLLLLWSEYLGGAGASARSLRGWPVVALGAFVLANGWHVSQLVLLGRGHYQDVIALMARDTRGAQVLVVVDHQFRQGMMLDYYGHRLGLSKPLQVGNPTASNLHATEWLLTHDLGVDFVPESTITTPDGVTFRLVAHYPFAGLSGWNLCLYRRAPA
jgi:hypothetical protein